MLIQEWNEKREKNAKTSPIISLEDLHKFEDELSNDDLLDWAERTFNHRNEAGWGQTSIQRLLVKIIKLQTAKLHIAEFVDHSDEGGFSRLVGVFSSRELAEAAVQEHIEFYMKSEFDDNGQKRYRDKGSYAIYSCTLNELDFYR